MDNFKIVTDDIIEAIGSLKYNDKEKLLIQGEIMINLRKLLESQEHYHEEIEFLRKKQEAKRLELINNGGQL